MRSQRERWMHVRRCAETYGLDVRAISEAVDRGELRKDRAHGYRISSRDVRRWMRRMAVPS